MNPRIASLSVERLRALREIRIAGLGRVNLITGRNNTGKSSLLEALRILLSGASLAVVQGILSEREEDQGNAGDSDRSDATDGLFRLSTLFSGFPQLFENPGPITIETMGDPGPMRLSLGIDRFHVRTADDGMTPIGLGERAVGDDSSDWPGLPALVLAIDGREQILPLTYYGTSGATSSLALVSYRYRYGGTSPHAGPGERMSVPCVYVGPYAGEQTARLGALWDTIALSDREPDVVDALRIVDPRIGAVSMVGGDGARTRRMAIVRAANLPRPVPLRTYGDGLNRLFGIVLSLVNAKDGLLLIDEFENGMHHSVQLDAWRAIFRLATRLNIQVFATSHSWDAIEAFQKAAAETPEQGVLVRLTRRGEHIVPTVYCEDDLRVATRDRIEVR
jgi:hypothetical protein